MVFRQELTLADILLQATYIEYALPTGVHSSRVLDDIRRSNRSCLQEI